MSAQDYDGAPGISSQVVGKYLTASGKVGVEIFKHTSRTGRDSYSYRGAWGAGSGSNFADMNAILKSLLTYHPRHTIVISFSTK